MIGIARPMVCVGVAFVVVSACGAMDQAAAQAQEDPVAGTVDFRVSCSPQAQREFNRAVALLHHMTYPRSQQSFQKVAQIDPGCGMAHWGIAMTLFQPLWPTRPGPGDLRRGWESVQKAKQIGVGSERERMLVDAAAAFFQQPESADYWQRIRRWEQAMAKAHEALPEDAEVTAFYALAHLASAPPDDDSVATHSERAAELLLAVYRQNTSHPGAMHYLVHANDANGRERVSLDVTKKYEASAPRNPHALHMPTHIYVRLGDWDAVVRGNLLAAEAALAHPAGDRGQYVWDEFPHAIEYLVYAYLQQGADADAATQLARLHGTQGLEPTFKTAFHLASARARYVLERRAWGEAVQLEPRVPVLDWDRFVWPEAVTWFAKGLGAARERQVADARAAVERLAALGENASSAGEALFARNIHILELEVRAWIAHAERDTAASMSFSREAAELETSTPKHAVTPGPTLPAYELWGDLLLEQGRGADALQMYRTSLSVYPKRFNSLLGAARAAAAASDEKTARSFYQELLAVAVGSGRRAELEEARLFLSRRES